jgi:hypothetical protein
LPAGCTTHIVFDWNYVDKKTSFYFLKLYIELPIEIYGIYIQQPRPYTVLNLGCSNFRTPQGETEMEKREYVEVKS